MSPEIIQYAVVGLILLLAVWYLVRQLSPARRRNKGCCSGGGGADASALPPCCRGRGDAPKHKR